MRLAKQHLDIGMFTGDIAASLAFWGNRVGLRRDMVLPLAPGWEQHRFDAHGSVIKVNHHEPTPPQTPLAGYDTLVIARDAPEVWEGVGPAGERVRCVPRGTDGVTGIGIVLTTPDPAAMMRFYVGALEFDAVDERTARCGDTMLFFAEGRGGSEAEDFVASGGYRYLTVQIFDADAACEAIVARGGRLARAPENYGTIARVGFVKDPDGNWIEISARASLTGVTPG